MTISIEATRLLVVLLALAGILANFGISRDIRRNRRASRLLAAAGEVSQQELADLEDTARIDIRGARASAGAHAMFLALGLIALGSPVPGTDTVPLFGTHVSRALVSLGFAILWDAIQAVVVGAQVRNQLARVRYRRRPR